MIIEIRIPSPGESITEVELANWLVKDGDYVEKDQEIAEVESDKATLPLIASESGQVKFVANEGDTISVGNVACEIDTSVKGNNKQPEAKEEPKEKQKPEAKEDEPVKEDKASNKKETTEQNNDNKKVKTTPLAKKMMQENNLNVDDIINGLKKITTKEVETVLNTSEQIASTESPSTNSREEIREPMSKLRKKLSERLVSVKNETAMLTTFNEVNMGPVMALRKKYQKLFIEKHGIKVGFMSFFTKAVSQALLVYPKVNAQIDGDEIINPKYCDVGIAVQTDKGLMVPILRNTENMSLADIEHNIADLAKKARSFRLGIEEMKGGTFTITNGGVFGSLLSTPILNPPQSAILGMHNIVERPIAVDGKVEIHPMMYIALSYDHRMIDGKDSVSFLVKIKQLIENPFQMLIQGRDPEKALLEL